MIIIMVKERCAQIFERSEIAEIRRDRASKMVPGEVPERTTLNK